jgi:chromosome segregation ATPase
LRKPRRRGVAAISICHRCGVHIFEPMPRCPNCGTDVSPPAPVPVPEMIAQPVRASQPYSPSASAAVSAGPSAVLQTAVAEDDGEEEPSAATPEARNLARTADELQDAAAWVRQVEESLKLGQQSLSTLREAMEREISRLRPLAEETDQDLERITEENEKIRAARADLEQRWAKLKQREDELRKRTGEVFKRETAAAQAEKDLESNRQELQMAQSEIVARLAKVAQAEKEMAARLGSHEEEARKKEEALTARVKELEADVAKSKEQAKKEQRDEKRAATVAAEKAALEKRKAELDERETKLAAWELKIAKAREEIKGSKEKPPKGA